MKAVWMALVALAFAGFSLGVVSRVAALEGRVAALEAGPVGSDASALGVSTVKQLQAQASSSTQPILRVGQTGSSDIAHFTSAGTAVPPLIRFTNSGQIIASGFVTATATSTPTPTNAPTATP